MGVSVLLSTVLASFIRAWGANCLKECPYHSHIPYRDFGFCLLVTEDLTGCDNEFGDYCVVGCFHFDLDGVEVVFVDEVDDFIGSVVGHQEVGFRVGEDFEQSCMVDFVV